MLDFIHHNKRGTIEVRKDGKKCGEIVSGIGLEGRVFFQYWEGSTRKGGTNQKRLNSIEEVKSVLRLRFAHA